MAVTVHKIERYSVQVLNKRTGEQPKASIIVHLFNDQGAGCGHAVFKAYGDLAPEPPTGDQTAGTATAYYDIDFYQPFADILRLEDELYWKIEWRKIGPRDEVADVSLDTKEEVIGEFFSKLLEE